MCIYKMCKYYIFLHRNRKYINKKNMKNYSKYFTTIKLTPKRNMPERISPFVSKRLSK